jgi:hypothetical protein
MDSQQPSYPKAKGKGFFGIIAGTLIGFFAGVYVGFHPQWIPIKGVGPADDSTPTMPAPASQPTTRDH